MDIVLPNENLTSSLVDSAHFTRTLAPHVREGVAVVDRDLRFVLWNTRLEKLTGLAARDVQGKHVLELFPSFQDLGIVRNLKRALAGATFSSPAMVAREHGRARIIHEHDAPLFDQEDLCWTMPSYAPWRVAQGAIAGVIVVISDPSERLRAKRQLADGLARNQAVIDHLPDGMAMISSEGCIESFNLAAQRIFGYSAEELVGQNIAKLIAEPIPCNQACCLEQQQPFPHPLIGEQYTGVARQMLGRRKDASTFPLELVVSKIALLGGHLFTAQLRDISSRRAAEEELTAVSERLRQLAAHQESVREAERIRIAHELHDELGGLLTALKFDVNRLGQLPGIYLERVEKLRKTLDAAIRSTRTIIDDLHPPVLDQFGLWGAIEWYAGELATRCALRCQVLIAPELEEVNVPVAVGISLFRIVQEALSNIVKHAQAHSVIIRARRTAAAVIELEIIDDGKGLNREDLRKTGHWGILGMHERVRCHGGELALESAPGRGTTLRVSLRIA